MPAGLKAIRIFFLHPNLELLSSFLYLLPQTYSVIVYPVKLAVKENGMRLVRRSRRKIGKNEVKSRKIGRLKNIYIT